MATKIYAQPPRPQVPGWLLFALPVAAIALGLLGFIAYSQYQQGTVEQYICIPDSNSPGCETLRPRFAPRNQQR